MDSGRSLGTPTSINSAPDRDSPLGVFSDEYDLSQEDPRILQDVQRALRLKARREAIIKKRQSTNRASSIRTDYDLPPSLSTSSSPSRPPSSPGQPPSPTGNVGQANGSDIDFGPSVGSTSVVVHDHPVPLSSDNGMTLDWSGSVSETDRFEKRWPLSIKRKGKEVSPHLNVLAQQQEKVYSERLERIKKGASRSTLKKASITNDQLTRRYNFMNSPLSSYAAQFRLTDIARWYDSQGTDLKLALEQVESPTWLKHLQKKRKSPSYRSPWQLTAKVMEEYMRAHNPLNAAYPINEDALTDVVSKRSFSPPGISLAPVTSRGSSHVSFEPSLPRKLSFEGPVSFEPLTKSGRGSLDILSRRSGESGYSSTGSRSSNVAELGLVNGRRWPEDLSTRLQRKIMRDNEGVISTRNSLSEKSEKVLEMDEILHPEQKDPLPESDIRFVITEECNHEAALQPVEQNHSQGVSTADVNHLLPMRRGDAADITRDHKTSFPPHRLAPWTENKRRKPISQEIVRREYEVKAQLLEEATAQNHRIRQLLNRVSIVVKEYELAQTNALSSLSNHQHRLPRELMEAFNHDPAAVTGPTRRLRSWRAVDDIHNRLVKQRAIFRQFLSEQANQGQIVAESLLKEPANALISSLESLERYKTAIQYKAEETGEMLRKVQNVHMKVKTDYYVALSHTSAVYPELSVIVALEESYKDQYQQFWEFGMDALTFILDRVTPFWRTYGKTIGEDIRDFLIIPLYRNEFTGEAKRYPIKGVPKRSLRHWLGLCLFLLISITLTLLQTRGAITSIMHSGLRCIPYESIRWTALPFFWIMIVVQWFLVLTEFSILLLELVVLLWWTGWLVKLFT
ncbi:hypothetical protein AX17_000697 [Amanita inopinata Kibby_2008]|nr:hypothetical protein AX17_000697 [Amanita inopinata Kibby_2008]